MGLFDYPDQAAREVEPDILLFASLGEPDWRRVLNIIQTRRFGADEILVREGEDDPSFYILSEGTVEVVLARDGGEKIIATIGEGSVFGEIAFFDRQPRSATIRARTRGAAIRVTTDAFEQLSAWEPAIARVLLTDLGRILALRLRRTTSRI